MNDFQFNILIPIISIVGFFISVLSLFLFTILKDLILFGLIFGIGVFLMEIAFILEYRK